MSYDSDAITQGVVFFLTGSPTDSDIWTINLKAVIGQLLKLISFGQPIRICFAHGTLVMVQYLSFIYQNFTNKGAVDSNACIRRNQTRAALS
jgi:hypothetical protein